MAAAAAAAQQVRRRPGGCDWQEVGLCDLAGSCGAVRRSCGGRLDHHGDRRRRDHDHWTSCGCGACRSLGDHRTGGRLGCNGRRDRRHER